MDFIHLESPEALAASCLSWTLPIGLSFGECVVSWVRHFSWEFKLGLYLGQGVWLFYMLLLYRYCKKTGLGRQLCFYMFLTIKGKTNALAMQNTFFASALLVLPFSLGAAMSLFWSQTNPYFSVVIARIRAGLRPCLVLHTVSSLCRICLSLGSVRGPLQHGRSPVSPGELEHYQSFALWLKFSVSLCWF